MKKSKARVLVVDDYEPWRHFVASTLQDHPQFLIVAEVADGLPAVEKAQELQPDLILLDIGLPKLNGIEAARRIRKLAPNSKILFISENRSWEIARAALHTGAGGYLIKSEAARELLPAIRAVLQGKQFVTASLAGNLNDRSHAHTSDTKVKEVVTTPAKTIEASRHEVALYSDDRSLLENVTVFIGAALKAGNAAVVVATESLREGLRARLQAQGLDIAAATQQGSYIEVDAASLLSTFIAHGKLDQAGFLKAWDNLFLSAAKASTLKHARVAVYGAGAGLVWAQGNHETALQIERLVNQLTNRYNVDILCGYSLGSVEGGMHCPAFQPICTAHSAVHSY